MLFFGRLDDVGSWFGILLLLVVLTTSPSGLHGAEGMTAMEFERLSDTEKSTVLRAAASVWLEATQNIEYVVETRLSKLASVPAGFANEEEARIFSVFFHRLRRINDSHWIHQKWWFGNSTEGDPTTDSMILFDSQSGTRRTLATHHAMQGKYGRVTTEHAPECEHNMYGVNFDLGCTCSTSVPLVYLLEHQDHWSFHPSKIDGLIHVRMNDWACEEPVETYGVRDMWFDPAKGFLLVRQRRELNAVVEDDAPKVDWELRYIVTRTEQCDGLWFPAESVRTRITRGQATVVEMLLKELALGKVTPSDLGLEFPAGAEVIDEIEDTMYVEGDFTRQGGVRSSSAAPSEDRYPHYVFWILGAAVLLGAVAVARRFRSQHG